MFSKYFRLQPYCALINIITKIDNFTESKNEQKLQILEALYIKDNKPSFKIIIFEHNSHILKGLLHICR